MKSFFHSIFFIKRDCKNFQLFYFSVFSHENSIEEYDGLVNEQDNILDLEDNENQLKYGEFKNLPRVEIILRKLHEFPTEKF